MNSENRDRLQRIGGVRLDGLGDSGDYGTIAEYCSEEFALELYSQIATWHRLITGRDRVTCAGQAVWRHQLINGSRFLEVFVEERLALTDLKVMCTRGPLASGNGKEGPCQLTWHNISDPVEDNFTVIEWDPDKEHCDVFPHLVLLTRPEEPRTYTVLPMDPIFVEFEDMAVEAARIFGVYADINVCLVMEAQKCVYINKDGKHKRSRWRPRGGAVAHRSVTGTGLYSLHVGPLQEILKERPDAFQYHDEFDIESGEYTDRDYFAVEPVIALRKEIVRKVICEIRRVVDEYQPVIMRQWDGDASTLLQSVQEWLRVLGVPGTAKLMACSELATFSGQPLSPSQFFNAGLFKSMHGALDVMELDLFRAGLHSLVDKLLQPIYTASHIGYIRLLGQSERLACSPDSEAFWRRIQGQVMPVATCSAITLMRLEAWRRIEPLYRKYLPAVGTHRCSYSRAKEVVATLPLLMKVNERGPMWMWQAGEYVSILPAVVVRLDKQGELHCEDGPAAIDPDGTQVFAIHGDVDDSRSGINDAGG